MMLIVEADQGNSIATSYGSINRVGRTQKMVGCQVRGFARQFFVKRDEHRIGKRPYDVGVQSSSDRIT